MQKNLKVVVATCLALSLSACGLLPESSDETRTWPAEKLYSEAQDEMRIGQYESAVKLFERLESSYPFGTYAAQAQMEIAYAWSPDLYQA